MPKGLQKDVYELALIWLIALVAALAALIFINDSINIAVQQHQTELQQFRANYHYQIGP